MDDLLHSAVLGIVLGVATILILRRYPGEPFDFNTVDDDEISTSTVTRIAAETKEAEPTPQEIIQTIDEDQFAKNSKKLQKLFGVDESTVRDAIRMTKKEVGNKNSSKLDEPINFVTIAEWLLFVVVLALSWYAMKYTANGDIAAMVRGLFKSEFQTIENLARRA